MSRLKYGIGSYRSISAVSCSSTRDCAAGRKAGMARIRHPDVLDSRTPNRNTNRPTERPVRQV
ncbi:membrane protein [Anopheles sinensis]|uniref:Membrane protein n=1 Tax=Anopheles sinensis TaxID=74873 RepID=A0A084W661_ANOSI|nr:membrane protein [Anopheles sinensis]